jgi:hypothetical protein
MVSADEEVQEITTGGSQGHPEFRSANFIAGNAAYISDNDTPRRDNLDANGAISRDGIGASVAQIIP